MNGLRDFVLASVMSGSKSPILLKEIILFVELFHIVLRFAIV